jgi:hypothetical protein
MSIGICASTAALPVRLSPLATTFGSGRARSSILGTFGVTIMQGANSHSFVKNCTFTAINTWQDFTIVVPGPTVGTWATGAVAGVILMFTVKAGSTYLAAADGVWSAGLFLASPGVSNWLSIAGQTFDVANVGLYLDPLSTGVPAPWVAPDEAQELLACQRYYFNGGLFQMETAGYATGALRGTFFYPATMRTNAAITGTFTYANGSGGFFDNMGVRSVRVSCGVTGNANVSMTVNSIIGNSRM